MTTPVNPYLTVLASDSASGAVPGAPCSRPTLRSSTSRAPVSLAVALRSCSFLKRRPMSDATVRSADCARPDDCARAGTCAQPDDCAVPVARDEGAPTEQPVDAGVRVAGGEDPRSGADEAVPGADQCADEPGVRMVDGANLRSRADEVVQGADQCAVEAGVRMVDGANSRSRADEVVQGADQCAVEAGVRMVDGANSRSRADEAVPGADQCADASVERNRLVASGSRGIDAEPDVHAAGNGTVVAEEGDGPVVVEQHESVPTARASAGREDVAGRDGAAGADPADWAADIDADLALVCAEPAPPFGVETSECVVHVDEPGDLIAGVPAMIGFAPERSLVVLVLRAVPDRDDGAIIDAVMRFDLDQEGGRGRLRAEQVARCVAQVSAHDDVAEVLAVVVDDRSVEPDLCGSDIVARCGIGRFDMLVAALARRLAAQDIALAGAWAAREIRPGERWWSLFGEQRSGLLADPATSAVALSQVLDGRPVLGSRAELAAMVTEDVALQDEVAALLDTALAIARERYARAVRRGEPDAYSRQALEYVLWQVANLESDNEPMARELAELAAALRDRTVRDAMFALAVGDHAAAAEALWAALTRALRGRDRAEAAALLGYSAYARGDGPLAGIALEAALTADPDHPMALLLETSLSLGMRPEQMRRLARSGYHAAADLGIDLGEPSM
ncbi:DUF4192 domain-containing protein [Nocardia brasiliensis]|uniref:DUF4192 domain-containing protein n=1 Tax=Nocardia brasiliensis TaxID=37326 RepID=UPI002456A5A1|nr:DUF4192 domain-containing protein [Nocardia brasiliensis]